MEASRQDSKGLASIRAFASRNLASAGHWLGPKLRGERGTELATIVGLVGAILMVVSEFLPLFDVQAPGGGTFESPSGGSTHGYALLVIGVIAALGIVLARSTDQWRPAAAAAALGVFALAVVLIGDMPESVRSGLTESRRIGDASPAIGFWLELIATLMMTGGSAATAWVMRSRDVTA